MNAKQARLKHLDYVQHMLDASRQALNYVEGLTKDEFLQDSRTQDAVILKILVMGEAAAQLIAECPEFVEQHPEIEWKMMKGMRNRMAHGYFDINLDIVWTTVHGKVRETEVRLQQLI